jgi:phosphoglycolate phosphatase-like HAD superfamily hydrolase
MTKYGFVFDLDDTLVASSTIYYAIFSKVYETVLWDMYPTFINPGEIWHIYKTLSSGECLSDERISSIGITGLHKDDLFPRVMVETYIESCFSKGVMPKWDTARAVELHANHIYTHKYKMMPGAMKLLNYAARTKDITLFLLTSGSERLQRPKIEDKKIFNHFESITICPITKGKGEKLKELKEEYDDIDVWFMIGDSVPSDINPALANGYVACHIVKNMSHIAEGELLQVPCVMDRYLRFQDLDEFRLYFQGAFRNGKDELQVEERERSV